MTPNWKLTLSATSICLPTRRIGGTDAYISSPKTKRTMSENLSENLISDEFVKQFTGSAAANGITVALGLLVLLKRLVLANAKATYIVHVLMWK